MIKNVRSSLSHQISTIIIFVKCDHDNDYYKKKKKIFVL